MSQEGCEIPNVPCEKCENWNGCKKGLSVIEFYAGKDYKEIEKKFFEDRGLIVKHF